MTPGSMPLSTENFSGGASHSACKALFEGKPHRGSLPAAAGEREDAPRARGGLTAQVGANRTGERRLAQIIRRYGVEGSAPLCRPPPGLRRNHGPGAAAEHSAGGVSCRGLSDDDGISSRPVKLCVRITVGDGRSGCRFPRDGSPGGGKYQRRPRDYGIRGLLRRPRADPRVHSRKFRRAPADPHPHAGNGVSWMPASLRRWRRETWKRPSASSTCC